MNHIKLRSKTHMYTVYVLKVIPVLTQHLSLLSMNSSKFFSFYWMTT